VHVNGPRDRSQSIGGALVVQRNASDTAGSHSRRAIRDDVHAKWTNSVLDVAITANVTFQGTRTGPASRGQGKPEAQRLGERKPVVSPRRQGDHNRARDGLGANPVPSRTRLLRFRSRADTIAQERAFRRAGEFTATYTAPTTGVSQKLITATATRPRRTSYP